MSETVIKAGDTVRLRSGGPLMTFERPLKIDDIGSARCSCVWFDGQELRYAEFALETLETASKNPSPYTDDGKAVLVEKNFFEACARAKVDLGIVRVSLGSKVVDSLIADGSK